jgi:hypothetical protein
MSIRITFCCLLLTCSSFAHSEELESEITASVALDIICELNWWAMDVINGGESQYNFDSFECKEKNCTFLYAQSCWGIDTLPVIQRCTLPEQKFLDNDGDLSVLFLDDFLLCVQKNDEEYQDIEPSCGKYTRYDPIFCPGQELGQSPKFLWA